MRKLGVLVASGITVGSMVLASPLAWADDYRHRDRNDRYRRHHNDYRRYEYDRYRRHHHDARRYDRGHVRDFTVGVRIVDHDADDRGRRGPSQGDRWSLEFNLVDYRSRVGNGVADCRVTRANGRSWRGTKSHCDVAVPPARRRPADGGHNRRRRLRRRPRHPARSGAGAASSGALTARPYSGPAAATTATIGAGPATSPPRSTSADAISAILHQVTGPLRLPARPMRQPRAAQPAELGT